MLKKIFLLLIFFFPKVYSQHQIGTSPSQNSVKKADLSESLIDFATGTVNVNIPISEISAGSFKVPVSVNYSSSGFKPEEINSWVGMGWNLIAGGSISRVIYGYPDDVSNDQGVGILHTNTLNLIKNLNVNDSETNLSNLLNSFYNEKKDTQPDIFTIFINGQTLSFVFDENKEIRTLENQNFRIINYKNSSGILYRFDVWDSYGNKYIFDEVETTTETTFYRTLDVDYNNSNNESNSFTFNSVWHLKKIITADNKAIDFNYRTENIEYENRKIEVAKICKNNDCNNFPTCGNFDPQKKTYIATISKVIQQISGPNETIIFHKSNNERNDLKGGYKIEKIEKKSITSEFTEEYIFNSSYIQSNDILNIANPYINYRLQLNSIYFNGILKNEFTYNSLNAPNRFTTQQDYWGYYNGNGSLSLIPKIYFYYNNPNKKDFFYQKNTTEEFLVLPGVDRFSSLINSQMGMLKTIKNNLKNTTSFEYELNKFTHNGVVFEGNGLRVKSINYFSPSEYNYTKNYTYEINSTINGFVELLPSFSYFNPIRGIRYITNSNLYQEDSLFKYRLNLVSMPNVPFPVPLYEDEQPSLWSEFEKSFYRTLRFSTQINESNNNSYRVNYTSISEDFQGKRTDYNFLRNIITTDLPQNSELHSTQIYKVRSNYLNATPPNFYNIVDPEFPFIPIYTKSWKSVIPLNVCYYVNGTDLIRKEEFIYENRSKILSSNGSVHIANKIYGLKYDNLESINPLFFSVQQAVLNPYARYIYCFSKYPIIIESEKKLINQRVLNFFQGNQLEENTEFTYFDNLIFRIKKQNSKGQQKYTFFKYPDSFKLSKNISNSTSSFTLNNIYAIMVNNNQLNYPVEVTEKMNNKIISSYRSDFSAFISSEPNSIVNYGLFLPINSQKLEINSPIPSEELIMSQADITFDINNLGKMIYDNRFVTTSQTLMYDNNGNVLESKINNGPNVIYVWGYNKTKIIAKIENLNYTSLSNLTISNLQSLSNLDNDNCRLSTCKDEVLRVALNNLRNSYPNSFITTYTYDSLAGLISLTDPSGKTLYYNYDNQLRLVNIKDNEGKIISENEYNYKN